MTDSIWVHALICIGVTVALGLVNTYLPPQEERTQRIIDNANSMVERSVGLGRLITVLFMLTLLCGPIYIPIGAAWIIAAGSDHALIGWREKLEFLYLAIVCVGIGLRGYATWITSFVNLIVIGFVLLGVSAVMTWISN